MRFRTLFPPCFFILVATLAATPREPGLTPRPSQGGRSGAVGQEQAASSRPVTEAELARGFTQSVRPFLDAYCVGCHGGAQPAAQFDLRTYTTLAGVIDDYPRWALVAERLQAGEMPPRQAKQPAADLRDGVIEWIAAVRRHEARRTAGDPGVVLARRLSNAEYNYTIRDLTGVDIRPAREFPVDPANPAGFDNSGESLSMSPALFTKYLQASREVATHLVFKPNGLSFAAHPMLVETDRDKYAINQIVDFYRRHNTDLSDYFAAAWHFKHRAALGQPKATLASVAAERNVSAKYLVTIWRTLEDTKEDVGPIARLQRMWREAPAAKQADAVAAHSDAMREFVVQLRRKIAFKYTPIQVKGLGETAQPFLMWRNRQYAANRRSFNRAALDSEVEVPAAERARYEAAFARFASVFPDAFYVSERGRYFPDNTRDTGRHLSAGFHNVMGYFRDDRPLYELILDEKGQQELDAMWQELDFVALGLTRTFIQFFLNESGEARGLRREAEGPRPADKEITSEAVVHEVAEAYRNRIRQANDAIAMQAIDEHFAWVNAQLRWVEKAKVDAEPTHLDAVQAFAARAYRRPLTMEERAGLVGYYQSLRQQSSLDHEEAVRDVVVSILMSPDFCYRVDLLGDAAAPLPAAARAKAGQPAGTQALSDYALASRLSYFLWSSMPDAELLARAQAGDLRKPEVLAAQARRMLKDDRIRGLATEFGGHWLDFRRFEEHNAVDRERFPVFDNALRQAMFEEPIHFLLDVFRENRSVLDFLYGRHTFVNPVLARHYGMPVGGDDANAWTRVEDADRYGRGGLFPMAVFLTRNAPGLRTSPVKRGYWVVKQVLGERIPPPPAVVPELPRDEARLDLPLRDLLARHREDKTCASCHARFDSLGLVFEGYGPVGERRTQDLSGRPIDASAAFPGGTRGAGLDGLRDYVRAARQDDFVDNLSRKLLAYALGRSLILGDEPLIASMRATLARDGYRFESLIESIVTSPQFRNKRAGM